MDAGAKDRIIQHFPDDELEEITRKGQTKRRLQDIMRDIDNQPSPDQVDEVHREIKARNKTINKVTKAKREGENLAYNPHADEILIQRKSDQRIKDSIKVPDTMLFSRTSKNLHERREDGRIGDKLA